MAASVEALNEGAWLVEEPELKTLIVTGSDAQSWLNGLVTCDVKSLLPGQGAWGLALTKQGKIQADLNVIVTPNAIFASTPSSAHDGLLAALREFLIMEDAELADGSQDFGWLALHGARALDVARAVAPAYEAFSAGIDWTGLGGAAIVAPRSALASLRGAIAEQPGVASASREAWEQLRISTLTPAFGKDFGPDDNPHEASLDRRAVSWTKGCYLGQEVVCMQDMRGKVKRRVVAVATAGGAPPERGTQVLALGEPVGEITSSLGPSGGPFALARVSTKALESKSALSAAGESLSIANRPPS